MKKILIFSADPGGAECLIPVIRELPEDIEPVVMSKNTACRIFEKYSAPFLRVNDMKFHDIEAKLDDYAIDAVLTSASSLPEKDMTEKLLWRWAGKKMIPSVAVLDQWQNYADRFSGVDEAERLTYLPDMIAIMDELAKREMKDAGFPEERLCVTGQPALENFVKLAEQAKRPDKENRLKKSKEDMIITFFSQPMRALHGDGIGYNEKMVLDDILSVAAVLQEEWKKTIKVLCKLHPKDEMDDLKFKSHGSSVKPQFVRDEYSNPELIVSSDIVIGMASIMLIHSVIAGIPTICYEPSVEKRSSRCMPVRIGAIPHVVTKNSLTELIKKLYRDPAFMKKYLQDQMLCGTHKGAAGKVAALVVSMLGEPRKPD